MRIKSKFAAVSLALLAVGGLGFAASPANAVTGIGVSANMAGESGYYVNDNGHTRIRDAQSTVTVTSQIKNLNGDTSANPGALGNELCDPNTGYAAQIGVWWDSAASKFKVSYGTGPLALANDPCIMSGFALPLTSAPQLLSFSNINVGDVIHLDVFFQPSGYLHYIKFNACDITQDICRQAKVFTGWHDFYEAGIGAVTNETHLTAPANNLLDTFTQTSFNYYSSTSAINSILSWHWELKEANFINSSSQVTMSPNDSLTPDGKAFNLFEGSTSA